MPVRHSRGLAIDQAADARGLGDRHFILSSEEGSQIGCAGNQDQRAYAIDAKPISHVRTSTSVPTPQVCPRRMCAPRQYPPMARYLRLIYLQCQGISAILNAAT